MRNLNMKSQQKRKRSPDEGLKMSLERLRKFFDSIDDRINSLKNRLEKEKKVSSERYRLLNQMVGRFIAYDKARDKFIGFLCSELAKAGIDYESSKKWDRLHMIQDEKFCQVREICRIVKKNQDLLWC